MKQMATVLAVLQNGDAEVLVARDFAAFAATQAEGAALWAGFFGFALGIAAAVLLNRRARPVRPTIVRVVR